MEGSLSRQKPKSISRSWKLLCTTLYSLARGWVAMGLSFVFSILYVRAGRITIEGTCDSVASLGHSSGAFRFCGFHARFGSGGLVTLFPRQFWPRSSACVLVIFTARVWNMVFGYYDALKGGSHEFRQMG